MTGASDQDVRALDRLASDREFQSLDSYVAPFSILGTLNLTRDELSHSRLIADLFDPSKNRHALEAIRRFLSALAETYAETNNPNPQLLRQLGSLTEADPDSISTARERERIDVLLKIRGDTSAAIAIENKIDANERTDQLSDYQATLQRLFSDEWARVVVFLTPNGRPAATDNPDSPIPCINIGYDVIADSTEAIPETSTASDAPAARELARHIREEIVGDAPVKDRARAIWNQHPHALRVLLRHRPKLEDIRDDYFSLVQQKFGDDAKSTVYPEQRGDAKELKFELRSWQERGCELVFMLHTQKIGSSQDHPRFRLLVRKSWYSDHSEALKRLAKIVNEADVDLRLDEQFEPLPSWVWRRVIKDEGLYPESATVDPIVIPGETEVKAFERAEDLYHKLNPHIMSMPKI